MKYLFRDRIGKGQMLATFLKESSDVHPDHHDYHPHFELYLRREPLEQEITLGGKIVRVDCPVAVLTSPFSIHAMSPARVDCPRFERHVVYFSEAFKDACALLPAELLTGEADHLLPLTAEAIAKIFPLTETIFDEDLPERERAAALALLLTRLSRLVPPEARVRFDKTSDYVPRVLQFLYEHTAETFTTDEIAARFHVSRAKLDRDFRASVGQSVHRAVLDLRLANARALLRETALPIREVATRCGFSSEYYFHAFFRRETGTTPLAVRRAGRADLTASLLLYHGLE